MTIAFARLLTLVGLVFLGRVGQAAERCESPPTLRFSFVPVGGIEARLKVYQPLFNPHCPLERERVAPARASRLASPR